jgi:hypothetical protein
LLLLARGFAGVPAPLVKTPYSETMQDRTDDQRRRALASVVATRLERVRGGMTDAEFGQLIADMVRVYERFAEIEMGRDALANLPTDPDEIRRVLGIGKL